MTHNKLLILGGDARSLALGASLGGASNGICYYGFRDAVCFSSVGEALADAAAVILPLPVTRDGTTLFAPLAQTALPLSDIAAAARPGTTILGGRLPRGFYAAVRDCEVIDYAANEELALLNAVATAEGVAGLLIDRLPVTVQNLPCAVVGYGRIGRATARLLKSMDAAVTVFARNATALTEAAICGLAAEPLGDFAAKQRSFGAVVNTIPAPVLGRAELTTLPQSCLLIETASAPFGIDFTAAEALALTVVKAGGLPGAVAPQTAGENLARALRPLLQKKGLIA